MTENISVTPDTIKLREEFVQNLNGSTMGEVVLFGFQFPLLALIALSVELYVLNKFNISAFKITPSGKINALLIFFVEAIVIVLPVTLMLTLLADFVHLVLLFISLTITLIIVSSVSSVDDSVLYWKLPNFKEILFSDINLSKKQPFITYFRSFVFLGTTASILGVDFNIYPRRFAKTETYGVSLMDLGVGLFIVSNALVEKRNASSIEIKKTLTVSFVLTILGVLRYVLLQRFDYQKHVSEYGLHWNFFITLAFVKLLSTTCMKLFRGHSFIIGIVLISIHQYFLSYSLESLVLNNKERSDWFDANREGIVSLCGYLSLYQIGITIASFVNPTNQHCTSKLKLKTIIILSVISVILFCVLLYFQSIDFKVSRRLANLPYVIWITAISLELLASFLLVEFLSVWFLPLHPKFKNKLYYLLTPVLLESINFNGLLFFLISNLITGLVNINVDVLNFEVFSSLLILIMYMFVNCGFVFGLYVLNIRIKL